MLTVTKITNKPCSICMDAKNVVEARFADGLAGNFCWRCAWRMVQARAKNGADDEQHKAGEKATA